jgi:hypothetical protein
MLGGHDEKRKTRIKNEIKGKKTENDTPIGSDDDRKSSLHYDG